MKKSQKHSGKKQKEQPGQNNIEILGNWTTIGVDFKFGDRLMCYERTFVNDDHLLCAKLKVYYGPNPEVLMGPEADSIILQLRKIINQ